MGAGSGQLGSGSTGSGDVYRRKPELSEAVEEARRQALQRAQADRDPEAIRRDIESTRANLSETVDAIQQKLNPQRLKDEAVSTVREATVGRVEDMADDAMWKVKGAGYNVFETIKRNPVPSALLAVGLGWLMMESRTSGQNGQNGHYEGRSRNYGGGRYSEGSRSSGSGYIGERYFGGYPSQASLENYEGQEQGRGRIQDATQGAREKVSDAAQSARETVSDVAEGARETVSNVADEAQLRAQQLAEGAEWRARQVGNRFSEMMNDNPLLIAVGAAALGAVIGFALPSTQKESEMFGEARDNLMERAQETASETMQKVQRVAEEAGSAAKEAARNEADSQGLVSQKK